MKVLIACEFSGIVRDAFTKLGHDATSCDLLPSEKPGKHIQGDVLQVLKYNKFDLLIAHPPCTHLAVSGARWFKDKKDEQFSALFFVKQLMDANVQYICIENPISIISSRIRKPDQIIQPWMFGHGETKATCLWLKGLPKLNPTNVVSGREAKVHKMPPSKDRWKERSRTYPGIAEAMAIQWSNIMEVKSGCDANDDAGQDCEKNGGVRKMRSDCKNIIVEDYIYSGNYIFGTFYQIKKSSEGDEETFYILDDGDIYSEKNLKNSGYKYIFLDSEDIIEAFKKRFDEVKPNSSQD